MLTAAEGRTAIGGQAGLHALTEKQIISAKTVV